jgi:hypothetical protein
MRQWIAEFFPYGIFLNALVSVNLAHSKRSVLLKKFEALLGHLTQLKGAEEYWGHVGVGHAGSDCRQYTFSTHD